MLTPQAKGFTLIELLVVVFIIGLVISVAMILPGSLYSERKINEASSRLASLFNMASEKAVLSDRETGFSLKGSTYHWWERNREKNTWQALNEGSWLPHKVSDDVVLTMVEPEPMNHNRPDIVFYTDGTMTPTKIILSHQNKEESRKILESKGVAIFEEQ